MRKCKILIDRLVIGAVIYKKGQTITLSAIDADKYVNAGAVEILKEEVKPTKKNKTELIS